MWTPGHLRPGCLQAGIAEGFQADLGGVVPDHGVVTHHLKKRATGFGGRFEFLLVGKFLELAALLFWGALHEFVLEERLTAGIDPVQPSNKSVLRLIPRRNGIVGGANFP